MITISRRQARRLRAVLRRSVLGIGPRGSIPPLVFRAEGAQLRVQHRYAALAVEHVQPGVFEPREVIALPLDALADVEGKDDSPVVLEAAAPDRTVVRWIDHGVPLMRDYAVPAVAALAAFPDAPRSWSETPADLLDALAEATNTGSDDNARYALSCIQLQGDSRQIVATDGHQLLVQRGFSFPFDGAVLVKRSPVFANKEFARNRPLGVGKTDTHVVLRVGPWNLFLEIQNARFPDVDHVLPDASAPVTRLRLDPGDAAFLVQALDRLPGAGECNSPATLDLNGCVVIRAQAPDQERATELVLARSEYTGAPVRINANRAFLGRALRLGHDEFAIADADAPVVCRNGRGTYAFQPLSPESALPPADDVTRIQPPSPRPTPTSDVNHRHRGELPVSPKVPTRTQLSPQPSATNGHAATGEHPGGLAALIQETEALHEALSDARARAGRLTVALRRYRRRERLVNTTLASLKALKLQEVAE